MRGLAAGKVCRTPLGMKKKQIGGKIDAFYNILSNYSIFY